MESELCIKVRQKKSPLPIDLYSPHHITMLVFLVLIFMSSCTKAVLEKRTLITTYISAFQIRKFLQAVGFNYLFFQYSIRFIKIKVNVTNIFIL